MRQGNRSFRQAPWHHSLRLSGKTRPFTRLVLIAWLVTGLALVIVLRHAHAATDEARTVAQLDTQYQAAVEKNDVATMDKLLADDFVLVTGSGKNYTKQDLLNDARSG